MELPAVTVVVPACNAERWIAESLSSIVAQSYPAESLEIVVVDDGSTDRTSAVAAATLNQSGIVHTIIRKESPAGPSAARNSGWRTGRGQWLQFLDADDRLAPSKIALQVHAAATASPDIAALHSAWARLVQREGKWVPATLTQPRTGGDPLLDVLRADNFMQLGCLLFSRKWLEKVNGFDESFWFIEDVDLLLRLVMNGAALLAVESAQPLSWYRQHSASLSRSDDRGFVEGCVRNARLVECHWRDRGQLTPERTEVLAGIYFMGARFFSGRDTHLFHALVHDVYRLEPNFLPKEPRTLRILTRLFGYPRAERYAVQYRRLKQSIRPEARA
jgi:glycosyltransferase involved in cell wall biosynthesis